ncbi:MAG: prepilin-type N-terminal cleavage/methylation domain-containing protein, partial [Acidobacteriota bacterium]
MMSEKHRKTQTGFTLVEVLVATAIFVVIFVAALLIYDRSNRVFKSGMEATDVQQNTRVAFDKVLGDLRMAGFDYDRDGNPSGSAAGVTWQQQADEQIEYAGPTAITLRANFNYETATGPCPTTILTTTPPCEHGREAALELSSGGVFPVVTTGNDEIVTYGLESADSSKNTGQIKYYADVPDRKSYQNEVSAGLTGRAENLVTITGVDLTNNNPPYTLYRYTLDPGVGAVTVVRTPVANGIRSMRFQYYEDPTGVIPLTDLAATPAAVTGAADSVAADRYNPAAPDAIIAVRQIREKIQSIRLTLIGMNESPDSAYAEPLDSTPKAVFGYSGSTSKNFRQYRLESLIVPRNYGKSGLKEQETVAPGPPTITRICVGYCGLAYIEWDSPVIDATHGSPEDYQILVGTTSTTVTTLALDAGLTNSATVPLSDRTASYYFVVKAVNSFGSQNSAVQGPYSVKNATRPNPPDFSTAVITGGGGANPPALPGHIQLTWQAPTTNASGAISCPFGGGSAAATNVREIKQWIVERAEDAGFTVNKKTRTFTQTPDPITGQVMIDDTVANCVTYYYRV